jgi:hypothetical protein
LKPLASPAPQQAQCEVRSAGRQLHAAFLVDLIHQIALLASELNGLSGAIPLYIIWAA